MCLQLPARGCASALGALNSDFWSYLVSQLTHSEPIIWNAVLAIGSLYERSRISPYPIELVGVQPVIDTTDLLPVLKSTYNTIHMTHL
jgi:hypothetical protein